MRYLRVSRALLELSRQHKNVLIEQSRNVLLTGTSLESGRNRRTANDPGRPKVCYYAAKKGFWIYVPTNARLLRPQVTDWLADAGVAVFNIAVDAVDEKPGLPQALSPVREYFKYLVPEAIPLWLLGVFQHQHLQKQYG